MACATVDPNAQYSFQLYCTLERAMVLLKIEGWGLKVDEDCAFWLRCSD